MWIIGALVQILIVGLLLGLLLQLASRIVLKDSIEFGDAFKSSLVATACIVLGDYALLAMFEGAGYTVARLVSFLVIWTLALMIVVGLDLAKSFLISVVFMAITYALLLVVAVIIATGG